jgi:hypothetical protein
MRTNEDHAQTALFRNVNLGLRTFRRRRLRVSLCSFREPLAEKDAAAEYGPHGAWKFTRGIGLRYKPESASLQRFIGDLDRIMLSEKQDPALWRHLTNVRRNLDPADIWEADIKKEQVGLQFSGATDSVSSRGAFSDDFEVRLGGED